MGRAGAMVLACLWAGIAAAQQPPAEMEAEMTEMPSETDLKSMSRDEALQRFGEPAARDEFDLSQDVPEFRIELLNLYSSDEIKNGPPRISEVTWALSPQKNLTIWYDRKNGGWAAVHYLEWQPGDDF